MQGLLTIYPPMVKFWSRTLNHKRLDAKDTVQRLPIASSPRIALDGVNRVGPLRNSTVLVR